MNYRSPGRGSRQAVNESPVDLKTHTADGTHRHPVAVAILGDTRLQLGAILLVAALLRFYALGNPCLWLDEANTYLIAREPLSSLPMRLANDASPPLYYALLGGWIQLFGSSEWALRSLGAGIGLLLVYAVYRVGRNCFSAPVGLWAAWMVATSPGQIFYAQQVRMYTLLPLLCLLSTYLLASFLNRPNYRLLAGYVVTAALALYTHNFTLNFLPFHFLLILWSRRLADRRLLCGCAMLLPILLWLPWISVFYTQVSGPDTYSWFAEQWSRWHLLYPILITLSSFSPGEGFVAPAAFAILSVFGLWVAFWRRDRRPAPGWVWIGGHLWLPILTSLLLSHLWVPHYLPGRVDQAMFPAYALLVALGIRRLPSRPARIALGLAILVLGTARAAERVYHLPGDDREMARAVSRTAEEGDDVLCTSLSRATVAYYLERDGVKARLHSYPAYTAEHLGGQDDRALLGDRDRLREEANAALDRIRRARWGRGRLYVVRVVAEVNEPLKATLAEREDFKLVKSFGPFKQGGTIQTVWVDIYRVGGGG
jgi:mannosyltransferase